MRMAEDATAALRSNGDALDLPLAERRFAAPITTGPDTSIRESLRAMSAAKVGSMVITDPTGQPIGIFTLKDLMNRVALRGQSYDAPIAQVMTPDPVTVSRSSFAFEAAVRMAERGIKHLCVTEGGRLIGVVSEHDLFRMHRMGLAALSSAISAAPDVPALAARGHEIHDLVGKMIARGIKVDQITRIIATLNDRITRRVIEIARAELSPDPEIAFTWLAFGSEGREEQTLKTDQDNGILFVAPDGMTDAAARTALLPIAHAINTALDACGFPLCTGGIMAGNPDCCLSATEWRARFAHWIDHGAPEHLLRAAIFFDFRAIDGAEAPVDALRDRLSALTTANSRFQRQMAAAAFRNVPPLGRFGGFRLRRTGRDAGTLDLKFAGVTPFVDAARILAVAQGVPQTNTVARLREAGRRRGIDPADLDAWIDAYDYIRLLRMRINEDQARAGSALTNLIAPRTLNTLDRKILCEAFREAQILQRKIALDYQL